MLAPLISCHISYTDLISSLLDQSIVDPGSTFIHVGAYEPKLETQTIFVKFQRTLL